MNTIPAILTGITNAPTLSEHFSWQEVTFSSTAERLGINNVYPPEITVAILNTARNMERVRALLGEPIHIDSWYRSPELNAAVHGVSTSQHLKGEAVDFLCPAYGSPLAICNKILRYPELIKFDQLILEHSWVHISFCSDPAVKPRAEVLSLLKSGGYASGLTDSDGKKL